MKEAFLKRVYAVWFHLHEVVKKANIVYGGKKNRTEGASVGIDRYKGAW